MFIEMQMNPLCVFFGSFETENPSEEGSPQAASLPLSTYSYNVTVH